MSDESLLRSGRQNCAEGPLSALVDMRPPAGDQGCAAARREQAGEKAPQVRPEHNGVRCRQIEPGDIEAVIALLRRGFPVRDVSYWRRGLERQGRANVPLEYPRYGYLIENNDRPVGAILLLCFAVKISGETGVRCNISSWYVEPAFRCYASMLIAAATPRRVATTYVNISPAPYTWPVVEAQGFKCHCRGQLFAIPLLNWPAAQSVLCRVTSEALPRLRLPVAEQRLLLSHADYGCVSVCITDMNGTAHPFVFLPFRLRVGFARVQIMHLIYCRDVGEFVRFSGNIGRFLLKFGTLLVAVESNGAIDGLKGFYRGKARMYFKGTQAPRLGDLAYTERVIFGP